MIRSSASVKVPDCLGGTEGPPWHLRRFTQRKVTNSLVAGEMSRVARLANRTRPHQDVALRRGRAKCEWQRPPVRRVEAGARLPAQYCCPGRIGKLQNCFLLERHIRRKTGEYVFPEGNSFG